MAIRKKRKPKTNRAKLNDALIEWTKFYVKARVGGQCFYAGKDETACSGYPTWGHIIAQAKSKYLQCDLMNLECECQGHNLAHKHNEGAFHVWWVMNDTERYNYLMNHKHYEWRPTITELEDAILKILDVCVEENLLTEENLDRFNFDLTKYSKCLAKEKGQEI